VTIVLAEVIVAKWNDAIVLATATRIDRMLCAGVKRFL
jgi:hypothetical protein